MINESADTDKDKQYLVPGLERGLSILTQFSPREPTLGAPELARRLGIPRTTVFRLLQTLESLGFLERVDSDRNYRLGIAVLRLGFEYLSSLELTDFGVPIIERLRDETGLTSHIIIRDMRNIVFVAKAQSNEPIFSSVKVNVGTRLPAHATIHGHVLMGDLSMDDLQALFPEPLTQYTSSTPATVEALYERVRAHADRGYAVSESSFERGISVVTAPVRNQSGKIAAVVTVTIPRPEIGQQDMAQSLVDRVRIAADRLSACLNYRPKADRTEQRYMKSLGIK